jgi:hypothetical protein
VLVAERTRFGLANRVTPVTAFPVPRHGLANGSSYKFRSYLPIESIYLDLLLSLGFVEQALLTHKRHGEPRIDGSRERLLAQTSYAAG